MARLVVFGLGTSVALHKTHILYCSSVSVILNGRMGALRHRDYSMIFYNQLQ